jgi:hypothetical protein
MDYKSFNYTLDMGQPPSEFHDTLKALWWERKGDWAKAHEIIRHIQQPDAAWVHAYLHRKEGDVNDSLKWYELAGKKPASGDLNEEFRNIISELLNKYNS